MAKLGRPPVENPKSVRIEIRLTREEMDMLDFCCRTTDMTRSEFLRRVIYRRYRKLSGAARTERK